MSVPCALPSIEARRARPAGVGLRVSPFDPARTATASNTAARAR